MTGYARARPSPWVAGQAWSVAIAEQIDQAVYELKNQMMVNVKDFGAVGDGSHDDTSNIQDAITAVSGGGKVYFPAGTYKIAGTLTLPSDNISFEGADRRAVVIIRSTDAIMFDVIGAHAATTTTLTRSNITFATLTLDGGNNTGWTTPMVRTYYAAQLRFLYVKFQFNWSECVRGLEWWDTHFFECFFEEAGGRSGTRPAVRANCVDPARSTTTTAAITNLQGTGTITVADTTGFAASGALWIAGNLIFYTGKTGTTFTGCSGGMASVNLPSGMVVEDDQRVASGIGHSTDNVNNIWFTNCHWESIRDGCAWFFGTGSQQANKIRFMTLKAENNVYVRYPAFFRFAGCNDVQMGGGLNLSMGALDTTAATTPPVGIWLTDTNNFAIDHTYYEAIGNSAASMRNFVVVGNGCNFVKLGRQAFSAGSVNKPTSAAVEFIGSQSGVDLDCYYVSNPGAAALFVGTPTSYTLKPKGGVSSTTPGAVTTVSIAHGMGIAPNGVTVTPANAAARDLMDNGAGGTTRVNPFHVTFDATNITLNFRAALAAATVYAWDYMVC